MATYELRVSRKNHLHDYPICNPSKTIDSDHNFLLIDQIFFVKNKISISSMAKIGLPRIQTIKYNPLLDSPLASPLTDLAKNWF
jgi:hypothetical protein